MSKIPFYKLTDEEKVQIFQSVSEQVGMTPFAVEKDWWVSRTLEIIFSMEASDYLVFKGGTSLSKAWKLIERFSEDVDLAIDKDIFMPKDTKWSRGKLTKLRKEAGTYSTSQFFEELQTEFKKRGFENLNFKVVEAKDSDQDPRIIEIYYPNLISATSDYIKPRVQLEIGSRSLREPFSLQDIGSLVDEVYAGRDFVDPLFKVPAVNPERTFLEKLFLLHEEFHRPIEKIRVDRLSRHLYDVYKLTKAGIAEKAIQDKELFETIVKHRYTFLRVGGVNYNLHDPKALNPTPVNDIIADWEKDYLTMQEEMIYEENKPTFSELINNLEKLKEELQKVSWKFELEFPLTKH